MWHCHILEHEDNEMMRPYKLVKAPVVAFNRASVAENAVNAPETPAAYTLDQNYPNPFNPSTQISFALPAAGEISLKVYNVNGDEVRRLASGVQSAGQHSVMWDGKDNRGKAVVSGIYFYRLQAGNFLQTKKMVLPAVASLKAARNPREGPDRSGPSPFLPSKRDLNPGTIETRIL